MAKTYLNQALSPNQIIDLLKRRGLKISDEQAATLFLKDVSYFRLAAYLRPMEDDKSTHKYKPNATFENAIELYNFDSALRQLIFSAIQHIEISLRTRMIQDFSAESNPFWCFDESQSCNSQNFLENRQHIERELLRCKEDFIKDHYRKYGADSFPPAWKTLEVITFGTLSKLFSNYRNTKTKKHIARSYQIPQHEILESWIKSINALRNGCAHHARVWNRTYAQIPLLPSRMKNRWLTNTTVDPMRLYAVISCLTYWLNAIAPTNTFVSDFKALLAEYPMVAPAAMGFPEGWQSEPLWK